MGPPENDNELDLPDELQGTANEPSDPDEDVDEPVDFLAKHNLYPTNVEQAESEVDLTLNDELVIHHLKLPGDQTAFVEWPRSARDERDDQHTFWFEDMALKKVLADVISNQRVSQDSGEDLTLTVERFHAHEEDNLLGFFDVSVNEVFTVKGAKLMVTDGDEWISWPARKNDAGEWDDLVTPTSSVHRRLIEAVLNKRNESS
jgi:DNA-binding cell septation regulator SpoVG